MISESLKINTTLTDLDLYGDERIKKRNRKIGYWNWKWAVNNIGAEGAEMISESLKINTTLTKLYLGSDDKIMKMKRGI